MINLIAYIPVLNKMYVNWFERHPESNLYLISNEVAMQLLPRLERNIGALPSYSVARFIRSERYARHVTVLHELIKTQIPNGVCIMPDEDVSVLFAKNYLSPGQVQYEEIWGRWDMKAVINAQPVIPDVVLSFNETDLARIKEAENLARRSPDWWRQIGIIAFRGDTPIGFGWNEHFPTEYETVMCGDPRMNFEAGDPAGMDAYVSLHAEEYLGAQCAKEGIFLKGASVYIDTFPCGRCARFLSLTGIKTLYFRKGYSFLKGFEVLKSRGIRIVQVRENPELA